MSTIKFRLAAKTNIGLLRTNNEDNFQVASDLASGQMCWVNNQEYSLGEKGTLLVVADGMGGMNAGEVASELVIETVREYFISDNLTAEVTKSRFSIEKFMNEVIVAADNKIKQDAKEHEDRNGMGTTIVIGWILDKKLYVSWCGDSRAYVYNPATGLHQITKDHSYVQTLVDKGAITREDAFDYPDNNIITRSLSDAQSKANPESLLKPYELCNGDIVLLCTDGLCGMIRDKEMETVIRKNEHNMNMLVDALIQAACDAGGSDNITICLCQILQGGGVSDTAVFEEFESRLNGKRKEHKMPESKEEKEQKRPVGKWLLYAALCCSVLLSIVFGIMLFAEKSSELKIGEQLENSNKVITQEVKKEEVTPQNIATEKDNQKNVKQKDANPTEEKQVEEKQVEEKHGVENQKDADRTEAKRPADKNRPADKKEVRAKEKSAVKLEEKDAPVQKEVVEEQTGQRQLDETVSTEDELTLIEKGENKEEQQAASGDDEQYYIIKKGDTYFMLARKFNVKVELLQKVNHNKVLKVGTKIVIPGKNAKK